MSGGAHLSKDFFELVKGIGESKSKQEEDRIILKEIETLKVKMAESGVSKKKMKEFLVRLVYCEMLGHEAGFGYIHAVKLAHEGALIEKKVGYMTVTACLHPEHELMILLVNTMRRDMTSSNILEVGSALTAATKLVSEETMPAVLDTVLELLGHSAEVIRKKAVMALHRFYTVSPDLLAPHLDRFRRVLCDKDPSVMGASLCILHDLALADTAGFKDLVPSFVSILKQITEHRLPRDFDYHRMPAPWIQIKLLRILALLGSNDQRASEDMYEVLHEVMKRSDTGINIGYAIVFECVRTVTAIYPSTHLLEIAAASVSRFVRSENHNLKYLGVNALAGIVQVCPRGTTHTHTTHTHTHTHALSLHGPRRSPLPGRHPSSSPASISFELCLGPSSTGEGLL